MSPSRIRRLAVALLVAAVVIAIDQATKAAAIAQLSETERIPLVGDLLGLQLAFNAGATLSIGANVTWLITLLGTAATVVLVIAATRARTVWWAVGIGFILGGAVGNLIDRFFSPPSFANGRVTDFLAYGELFIGNLADVFLGIGAAVLVIGMLQQQRRRARDRRIVEQARDASEDSRAVRS